MKTQFCDALFSIIMSFACLNVGIEFLVFGKLFHRSQVTVFQKKTGLYLSSKLNKQICAKCDHVVLESIGFIHGKMFVYRWNCIFLKATTVELHCMYVTKGMMVALLYNKFIKNFKFVNCTLQGAHTFKHFDNNKTIEFKDCCFDGTMEITSKDANVFSANRTQVLLGSKIWANPRR